MVKITSWIPGQIQVQPEECRERGGGGGGGVLGLQLVRVLYDCSSPE